MSSRRSFLGVGLLPRILGWHCVCRAGAVSTAASILPNETMDVEGVSRAYRLVIPSRLPKSGGVSLVFAFHGLGDSKDLMPLYTRLDLLAEKEGFVLVYPNAQRRMWPLVPQLAFGDLAFFDALHEKLVKTYSIDRRRVYLAGMSNGAYFTHLVASQRPGKVAAIAAHSGGLAMAPPKVTLKYGVFLAHGDRDNLVPVDQSRLARDAYVKWGHAVEYRELKGLRHAWGTRFGINAIIWEFFQNHPMPRTV